MNSLIRERSTNSAEGLQSGSGLAALTRASPLSLVPASPRAESIHAPAGAARSIFGRFLRGEDGIRDRLKIDCPCGLVGSSPTSGIAAGPGSGGLRGAARGAGAVVLGG